MCRLRSSCTCAKYHPGLCSPFILSVVSNDSVSGQWRPWSDCADAQSDLGLHCLQMPEDTFSYGAAQVRKRHAQKGLSEHTNSKGLGPRRPIRNLLLASIYHGVPDSVMQAINVLLRLCKQVNWYGSSFFTYAICPLRPGTAHNMSMTHIMTKP